MDSYTFSLLLSAVISAIVAAVTWRRKFSPGALPLFIMLITTVIWAGANVLMLSAETPLARLLWFDILVLGALSGTPALFLFALQYTGREKWLTRRNIILLSLIPVISIIAAWTNPWHGFFYDNIDFNAPSPSEGWIVEPGIGYNIFLAYSYPVVLYSIGIIGFAFFQSPRLYRGQSGAIFVGTLVPLLGNIIYNLLSDKAGNSWFDPTPILFTIMGLFYAYGLFSFRLFDIMPIARHTLIEHMADGVLVVDSKNRIIDVNAAAISHMKISHLSPIGLPLNALPFPIPESDKDPLDIEIETEDQPPRYFNLRSEILFNRQNNPSGRLIVFRDTTDKKIAEESLQEANRKLKSQITRVEALQLELRELAMRDPLTKLYNRRHLEAVIMHEVRRAEENRKSLCILMIEIDGFKSINDSFGHVSGDFVLQKVAECIQSSTRIGDTACRYGGDEFVLVMPETPIDMAMVCAERIRKNVADTVFRYQSQTLPTITLSIGVAGYPQHGVTGDQSLRAADQAMYKAKQSGKNRVITAELKEAT